MLTPDMRAVIQSAHLCFAATVTPDGRPNVSPKGTIRVWDDTHLFFLDIASPGTRTNLAHAPLLELNVVDQLSRRGYRFSGRATLYLPDSVVYADGVRRVYDATLPADPRHRPFLRCARIKPTSRGLEDDHANSSRKRSLP